LYYHSEALGKDVNYHLNKLEACLVKGYTLITIFEDEWLANNEITKSRLASYINNFGMTKIHARKCVIKDITPAQTRAFCVENHIQAYGSGAKVKIGAFYNDELVSVMTFSAPSIAKGQKVRKEGMWELHRFCSKKNYIITGIASRLLKYFENNYFWIEVFFFC
jgi:hypothetical protein